MGNSSPQIKIFRHDSSMKKSRSLREYPRHSSIITSCLHSHTRRTTSSVRLRSLPPTDAEIIDAHESDKQMAYIRSCVRKHKGLLGLMTENLQMKHIFSNDEPSNTHTLEQTPEDYNMNYQSIYLQTPDGEYLHAYWIEHTDDVNSTMTLLYFHGAGGNIAHRLEVVRLFYDNLQYNILIIDYRGFGKSSGSPSELGLYIDAQTAYDYLIHKQKIAPEKLFVLGTSLGASVAIQLVSDPSNQVKMAIFENAFVSVPEMARYLLSYAKNVIGVTKSIGFIYLFDSLKKVRRIQCPCLYLTGSLDPIVPTWMSKTLFSQTYAAKKTHLFEYPFGRHNDLPLMKDYFENIQTFLEQLPSTLDQRI